MLTQLRADPAELGAFGGAFGLGAGDVPAFVDSLSPVALRANTSVTDHPLADGAFVEQPAVLAPGTAVLVNSYGEPTVTCVNGNPLTGGASVSGAVTVTPTSRPMTGFRFTIVDDRGTVVVRLRFDLDLDRLRPQQLEGHREGRLQELTPAHRRRPVPTSWGGAFVRRRARRCWN